MNSKVFTLLGCAMCAVGGGMIGSTWQLKKVADEWEETVRYQEQTNQHQLFSIEALKKAERFQQAALDLVQNNCQIESDVATDLFSEEKQ